MKVQQGTSIAAAFSKLNRSSAFTDGLVIWTLGHKSRLWLEDHSVIVLVPGKWRLERESNRPLAPGDMVRLSGDKNHWRMEEILPRRNEFTRRQPSMVKPIPQVIAANLDLAVVVAAADEPITPLGLIDRLLVTAELGGVKPALVINKCDLIGDDEKAEYLRIYAKAVEYLLFTSAVSGEGIKALTELIQGRIVLLAGASGVGKTSLANCIDPALDLRVRQISSSTGKGVHTTTVSELFPITGGGWLTDTPGLRECGPYGKTPANIGEAFPEIRRLSKGCRFRNCVHRTEEGCTVIPAAGSRALPESRYESYLKLLAEAEEENRPDFRRVRGGR